MIKQSDITIIIPTLCEKNHHKFALNETRKSLQETVPDIKKIIIKNNGMNYFFNFGITRPNEEIVVLESQGQCRSVNAGIAITNTPWILVTNDDMIFPPGWFEALTKDIFMESCVSPILVEPAPGAPTFETYFCGGAGGDFDKQKFFDYAANRQIPVVPSIRKGFNLPFLIRRELWDIIGGYDINFDPWGSNSDSDLEYKIKLAGIQPYQNTACAVYHFSQTSGTFEPENQAYWQKNWDYFIAKWGFMRTDYKIWEADFEIPNEGRIFRPEWEGRYGR